MTVFLGRAFNSASLEAAVRVGSISRSTFEGLSLLKCSVFHDGNPPLILALRAKFK